VVGNKECVEEGQCQIGWRSSVVSVSGPLLFLMFINDLDYGVRNWIQKFADDTKIFGGISNQEDTVKLQKNLN